MSNLEGAYQVCRLTTKMLVDSFLKPVLLIVLFVRAEREAQWKLHLYAVEQMLPYYFCCWSCSLCPIRKLLSFSSKFLWLFSITGMTSTLCIFQLVFKMEYGQIC